MADLMIDLEGLGTGPDTTILTIAAQSFDPFGSGYCEPKYYARITLESQPDRSIQQSTIDWWATQPAAARDEAFAEQGRIPLDQALDELGRLIWHINRFLDRVRAAESRQQRDVTMTTAEARDLHTDITRLLLALQVSHEQKTAESTDNPVINIEVQGGAF